MRGNVRDLEGMQWIVRESERSGCGGGGVRGRGVDGGGGGGVRGRVRESEGE